MFVVPLVRQGVLGVTTLFSLIVLGVSAHLISQTRRYFDATVIFCALGASVAVISLVSLLVMLVVDIIRRGAYTSMIVVELIWLSILWVLWVATGGETVSGYNVSFPDGCKYVNIVYNGMCQETQVIVAFSFLNFIIILLYTIFLSVMAVNAASRGQSVWLSSVKESFDPLTGTVQHLMTQYDVSATQLVHPTGTPVQHRDAADPTRPMASPDGLAV